MWQSGTEADGGAICGELRACPWAATSRAEDVGSGSGEVVVCDRGARDGDTRGDGSGAGKAVGWVDGDVTQVYEYDDDAPSGRLPALLGELRARPRRSAAGGKDSRQDADERRPPGLTEAGGADERHRCSQPAMAAQVKAPFALRYSKRARGLPPVWHPTPRARG